MARSTHCRTPGSSRSKKYWRGTPKVSAPPAGAMPWTLVDFIAWNIRLASATERASGPTWSSVVLKGTTPAHGSSPNVGFRPTMPQAAAGMRIEPPVSVPTEANPIPVTTAAAEPPLEPPADRVRSTGLWTAPKAVSSLVVPNANSCRLVLPMTIAPASRRRLTTGASADAIAAGTFDAAVVGVPRTSTRSFTVIGMPCSGPRYRPAPISRSASAASASACSRISSVNAFRSRRLSALASASRTSSVAEMLRLRSSVAASAMWRPSRPLIMTAPRPPAPAVCRPTPPSAALRWIWPAFRAAASIRGARVAPRQRPQRRARLRQS